MASLIHFSWCITAFPHHWKLEYATRTHFFQRFMRSFECIERFKRQLAICSLFPEPVPHALDEAATTLVLW